MSQGITDSYLFFMSYIHICIFIIYYNITILKMIKCEKNILLDKIIKKYNIRLIKRAMYVDR